MRKPTVMRFRWEESHKRAFQRCAKARKKNASDLARNIIEAWLACQITPAERQALGFIPEWLNGEPALLTEAIGRFVHSGGTATMQL